MSSKINFKRRTFLEKEELNMFQDLLLKNSLRDVLIRASNSYGIVANNQTKDAAFKVDKVVSDSKSISIGDGVALLKNGEVVRKEGGDNIPVKAEEDNPPLWVFISNQNVNYEVGTVNLSTDGLLSGTVDFSKVGRGVQTKVPVYLKFQKEGLQNTDVYYISDIVGNNTVKIDNAYGGSISEESDLKVIILGSLPIGGTFTEEQLQGLYSYDNFKLSFVKEEHSDTQPDAPENSIVLARLTFGSDGSIQNVYDKRKEYWFIESSTVTTDRIEDGAVTTDKIEDGAVTPEKLAERYEPFDYVVDSIDKLRGLNSLTSEATIYIAKGMWEDTNLEITIKNTVKYIKGHPDSVISVKSFKYGGIAPNQDIVVERVTVKASLFPFFNFRNLKNCRAMAGEGASRVNLFTSCFNLVDCECIVGDSDQVNSCFSRSDNLINCNARIANSNTRGYVSCNKLVNCNVLATSTTAVGYDACRTINSSSYTGTGVAFRDCFGCFQCNKGEGSQSGSYFSNSVEGGNTYANTLNGGWNQ